MTIEINTHILLADDHQLVIDGLKSMFQNETRYVISGEANNGQEALSLIQSDPEKFQLVITDVSMSHMTGIELCRHIKQQYPEIKVLVLSMYSGVSVVKEALSAEADGYLLKSAGKDEFIQALHRITDGGTYFAQDIIPIIYNQYQREKAHQDALSILTTREREVLSLIVKEHTSEEIARKLFLSKKTVDNHRQNILAKTGCKTTIGLVKFAIRNGME
ncbi:MAG: response regulator transcription factor [Bacteroidia bacterium]|jgi:DNA-binding NarL/FixJ family response regulator|nr:response regulator transcription factor [Bacteroidia bacterium]